MSGPEAGGRRWGAVYALVILNLLAWIVLMRVFSRVFS